MRLLLEFGADATARANVRRRAASGSRGVGRGGVGAPSVAAAGGGCGRVGGGGGRSPRLCTNRDAWLPPQDGKTALDLAKQQKHKEVVALLEVRRRGGREGPGRGEAGRIGRGGMGRNRRGDCVITEVIAEVITKVIT